MGAHQLRLIHLKKILIYLPIVEDNNIEIDLFCNEKSRDKITFTSTQHL